MRKDSVSSREASLEEPTPFLSPAKAERDRTLGAGSFEPSLSRKEPRARPRLSPRFHQGATGRQPEADAEAELFSRASSAAPAEPEPRCNLKEALCARLACDPKQFTRLMLLNTINPAQKPIAAALWTLRRGLFSWEELYLRRLGALTSHPDALQECLRVRSESYLNSHPLPRFFHIRLSGRRLARLSDLASHDGKTYALRKPHILIVSANREMTANAKRSLPLNSARFTSAQDGVDTLKKLRAARLDLVLTDSRLPDMTARELLADIRTRLPSLPVILIVRRGEKRPASNDIAEFQGQVASASAPKVLARAIRSALARARPLTEA